MFRKFPPDRPLAASVTISIDGAPIEAEEGEPLAAVLMRSPPPIARRTPVTGSLRAPFCMMGVCFDCLLEVDGATSVRSCQKPVAAGMVVRRQCTRPDPATDLGE